MKKTLLLSILTVLLVAPVLVGAQTSAESTVVGQCVNGRNTVTGRTCVVVAQGSGSGGTQSGQIAQSQGTNLGYTPLEPIPGLTTGANGEQLNFPQLLGNIYKIAITIGALFSVLMLTLSGIRYMVSDIVTDKDKAKKRITASLYGLVLIAASWLILNTINPQLVKFNLAPQPVSVNSQNSIQTGAQTQTQTIEKYQDQINEAINGQHSAAECAAATQWLNTSGNRLGIPSQAADLNGQLLRGGITSEQRDAIRSQRTQLVQQNALNQAIEASCNGNK